MRKAVTVAAPHLAILLQAGARRGLDVPALLATLGIGRDLFADPDARVSHEVFARAWEEVPRQTGIKGVEVARFLVEQPHLLIGVLLYIARSSVTLGDAWEKVIRYHRIVHDAGSVHFEQDGTGGRFFLRPPAGIVIPPEAREFIFAMIVGFGRRLASVDWAPRRVAFEHPAPADATEQRQLFAAPVDYGQPCSEMLVDRSVLARRLATADPLLNQIVEQHARELLAHRPASDSLIEQLRSWIFNRIGTGLPELADVARELGTSPRTLQRRLADEQMTWRDLVDDVRRELAERRMTDPRASTTEVAFVLGFSDGSAFTRAFRRWTGHAPAEYRRLHARTSGGVSGR
jgi:AraC-like DNA-binding protein